MWLYWASNTYRFKFPLTRLLAAADSLLVPARMFSLLMVVCHSWMQYMWISVSAALFSDWSHGYSPGQSIFAELGYSFSTAVSCLLPGLISISGSFFCHIFISTFLLGLTKTKGLRLHLKSIWVWQSFSLRAIALLSTSNNKPAVRFSPIHLTSTTVDHLPVVHSNHGRKGCPFNTVVHTELGLQMFPAFCFSSLLPCYKTFMAGIWEKRKWCNNGKKIQQKTTNSTWLNPTSAHTA